MGDPVRVPPNHGGLASSRTDARRAPLPDLSSPLTWRRLSWCLVDVPVQGVCSPSAGDVQEAAFKAA
jgi:hypothetical protein